VGLLDQVLQKHLSSDGDYEGGVIAAAVDVVVLRDDLLDTGDWKCVRWCYWYYRVLQDVRGRETVPVISLEGAIGVLLYGMAGGGGGGGWYVGEKTVFGRFERVKYSSQ